MDLPKLKKPWTFVGRRRIVYPDGFTLMITGYQAGDDQAVVSVDRIDGHEYAHLSFVRPGDSGNRERAIKDVFGNTPVRTYTTNDMKLSAEETLHVVPADYPPEYAEFRNEPDVGKA